MNKTIEKLKKRITGLKTNIEMDNLFRKHFIEESMERGKAISVLMENVNQDFIVDCLSELYDFRQEKKRKEMGK